jgi:hypothetical protein
LIFNLKKLNDPRYQSELSLLSMTIDSIVGRPSNVDRFSRDLFGYDDTRKAFDLFVTETKTLDNADAESWTTAHGKLISLGSEPAILAARSLKWAMNNRNWV